jgi:hypothetical protein
MNVLLDTNILARMLQPGPPSAQLAQQATDALRKRGDQPCLVPQNFYRRFPRRVIPPQFRGDALLFRVRIRRAGRLLRVLFPPPVAFLPFSLPLHLPSRFPGTALRTGKTTSRFTAPWGTCCCRPTISDDPSPESHPPCGAASWTIPLASATSWNPTSPCIVATPPCAPSSSTADLSKPSLSSSVPLTTPYVPGCATSAPPAGPARFPPFRRAAFGPASSPRQLRGAGPTP